MRVISLRVPQPLFCVMSLKVILLKLLPDLSGTSEFLFPVTVDHLLFTLYPVHMSGSGLGAFLRCWPPPTMFFNLLDGGTKLLPEPFFHYLNQC